MILPQGMQYHIYYPGGTFALRHRWDTNEIFTPPIYCVRMYNYVIYTPPIEQSDWSDLVTTMLQIYY